MARPTFARSFGEARLAPLGGLPRFAVGLDVETTSLDPATGEIIEVAAIRYDTKTNAEVGRFTKLCRPSQPITREITAITGITNDLVKNEQPFSRYIKELQEFIDADIVFAHNASFDLKYLAYHGLSLSNLVWDTFQLASIAWPQAPSYNLGILTEEESAAARNTSQNNNEHRAPFDVYLTWCLLAKIRHNLAVSAASYTSICRLLKSTSQEHLMPLFSIKKNHPPAKAATPASIKSDNSGAELDIDQILGDKGSLEKNLPGFSPRPEQVKMANIVEENIKNRKISLIEAPPGTGKTYGYLVPAILGILQAKKLQPAANTDPKFIVSTYTRHLQDQLVLHDIPKIIEALRVNLKVAGLKGRRNYLCTTRLNQALQRLTHSREESTTLMKLLVWLDQGGSGDLERLNVSHQSDRLLRQLHADSPQCRHVCPLKNRSCPYYQARRHARRSDLLVINHSLLSQLTINDTAEQSPGNIPHSEPQEITRPDSQTTRLNDPEKSANHSYQTWLSSDGSISQINLIIDEAHHLEEAARDASSHDLSFDRLDEIAASLLRLIKALSRPSSRKTKTPASQSQHIMAETKALVKDYQLWLQEVMDFIDQHSPQGIYRLSLSSRKNSSWLALREKGIQWRNRLQFIIGLIQGIPTNSSQDFNGLDTTADAKEFSHQFYDFIIGNPDRIQWIELKRPSYGDYPPSVSLNDVALSVAHLLEPVWKDAKSVLLTSATLTINAKFDYIKGSLGIIHSDDHMLLSPFDLRKQMLIYITDDSPHPQKSDYSQFTARLIVDIALLTSGRLLALFTSEESIRTAYHTALSKLNKANLRLLAQHMTGGRYQVVSKFKKIPSSVLLGTYGLWEGIDVPGESLSTVVIAKLPFVPPHDPVIDALAEANDQDPFIDFALPKMILRLRQGVGRLIRSTSDYGTLVICDSRFLYADYGNQVLSSLPPAHIHIGSRRDLLPTLTDWFGQDTLDRWKKQPASF